MFNELILVAVGSACSVVFTRFILWPRGRPAREQHAEWKNKCLRSDQQLGPATTAVYVYSPRH